MEMKRLGLVAAALLSATAFADYKPEAWNLADRDLDGTETAKTLKDGKTYVIAPKPGAYPVVKR